MLLHRVPRIRSISGSFVKNGAIEFTYARTPSMKTVGANKIFSEKKKERMRAKHRRCSFLLFHFFFLTPAPLFSPSRVLSSRVIVAIALITQGQCLSNSFSLVMICCFFFFTCPADLRPCLSLASSSSFGRCGKDTR